MELIATQRAKKFFLFYGTQSFITTFTRSLNWTLSSVRWIRPTPTHLISLRSMLIVSFHLRLGLPHTLFPYRNETSYNFKSAYFWICNKRLPALLYKGVCFKRPWVENKFRCSRCVGFNIQTCDQGSSGVLKVDEATKGKVAIPVLYKGVWGLEMTHSYAHTNILGGRDFMSATMIRRGLIITRIEPWAPTDLSQPSNRMLLKF